MSAAIVIGVITAGSFATAFSDHVRLISKREGEISTQFTTVNLSKKKRNKEIIENDYCGHLNTCLRRIHTSSVLLIPFTCEYKFAFFSFQRGYRPMFDDKGTWTKPGVPLEYTAPLRVVAASYHSV